HGNRGSRNVARQEISQSRGVGIATHCGRICSAERAPWPLCSVEGKFPRSTAVIELVHAALPEFTTETELVPAYVVGNDIGQHSGYIVAAFRGSKTDLLEAGDGDIRGAQNRLSLDGRVRAQEQAQCLGIEAVVGIAESLVEVVDAEQQLIRHPRGENGVKRGRVVVNVDRSFFEVKLEVRAGRSQCRTATQWRGLATLSAKPADGEAVFVGDVEVNLGDTVVAVSGRGNRTEEVAGFCRKRIDQRWPEDGVGVGCRIADQILRKRAWCNWRICAVRASRIIQQGQSLGLPRKRWFSGESRESDQVVLFLKGDEKECSVLNHGATHAESVILIAQCRRSRDGSAGLEEG